MMMRMGVCIKMSARSKGSGFERQIAKAVVAVYAAEFPKKNFDKTDCWRTPLSGGHHAISKHDPGDLQYSPRLKKLFPWSVECKSYRRLHWHRLMTKKKNKGHWNKWWSQCVKAAGKLGMSPLLIVKENGGQPMVIKIGGDMLQTPTIITRINGDIVYVSRFLPFLKEYAAWRHSQLRNTSK